MLLPVNRVFKPMHVIPRPPCNPEPWTPKARTPSEP